MKLDIDISKKFNLKKINLNLSKELNEAGKIIRKDHVTRLERGTGVDGNQMERLAASTIEAKGFNQILVNTGQMRNLDMERATASKQVVTVFPGKKRKRGKSETQKGVTNAQIGLYHQNGDGVPKREWFGISLEAENKSIKAIEFAIERALRRL